MTDQFDRKKRSEIMANVHSTNTIPEKFVCGILEELGYNFFQHANDLPGKPDIILLDYDTVIFINGCFWHGCPHCRHAKIRPQNNSVYWNAKLDKTLERDKKNRVKLEKLGYKVLVIWECETIKKNKDLLKNRIIDFLR